jgi:hypothetical protein
MTVANCQAEAGQMIGPMLRGRQIETRLATLFEEAIGLGSSWPLLRARMISMCLVDDGGFFQLVLCS